MANNIVDNLQFSNRCLTIYLIAICQLTTVLPLSIQFKQCHLSTFIKVMENPIKNPTVNQEIPYIVDSKFF